MKTNRDVRLSLSEAKKRPPYVHHRGAFGNLEYREADEVRHKPGWTPAPSATMFSKYEIEKPKTRDYDALTKAALRKPRSDDDALREKFGGGGSVPAGSPAGSNRGTQIASQPAAPASSDVWPKYLRGRVSGNCYLFHSDTNGEVLRANGSMGNTEYPYSSQFDSGDFDAITQVQFIAKLREWNHPALKEFDTPPDFTLTKENVNTFLDCAAPFSPDDPYEPVGTMPVVGDRVMRGWHGAVGAVTSFDEDGTCVNIVGWEARDFLRFTSANPFGEGEHGRCKILARKNPSTKALQDACAGVRKLADAILPAAEADKFDTPQGMAAMGRKS